MAHFLPLQSQSLLFLGAILLSQALLGNSVESDFTVDVGPGAKECFYQHIKQGATFEFEYQVIEGGELDINFIIQSPGGVILITDIRKQDAVHRLDAGEEGDFMFCLDNTFSHFANKLVFFEMVTPDADPNWNMENFPDLAPDEGLDNYDMKIEDFKGSFDIMKDKLDRSQQEQNRLRTYESRDRSVVESNFERVNWWSAIQLIVMVIVSVSQVVMIRSLFEDKSKVGQILKMRT